MRRSAANQRALGVVLLAVVLAVTCGLLGRWQWNRHTHRAAQIQLVVMNYDAEPVPLDELLTDTGAVLESDQVWRQVIVTGEYDPDGTVLLRNRPVGGQPGFHVLVPLVQPDQSVLIVDRGWVAWDVDASSEVQIPDPPSGETTVTVRIRQDEPTSHRDAPAGQVQAINVRQVLAAGGRADANSYVAYGALALEEPAPAIALGKLPAPSTDPGSHLSYAFQWWTFGFGALIGFGWLARREQREQNVMPAASRSRRRRRLTDEETEDALLDAQARVTKSR